MLAPTTETDLAEAIAAAAANRQPLEITGGGTRRGLGRPVQAAETLSTAALSGIELYEPGALTLVVRAGTPVAAVEAALASEGQRLAFEPMDHRALMGTDGEPTIGGVVACGVSGPRRLQAGACRDAMIGVRFVDGQGQTVRNGGRVMKNVTGYDLVRLMAGQYGTLGVLSEIGFKVLPSPEREITLVIEGLDEAHAVQALTAAVGQPFDVTGAAHLPGENGGARTAIRVEGMDAQADYRATRLSEVLAPFGETARVEGEAHAALWRDIRDCRPFAGREGAVWRLSLRPSKAAETVAAIRAQVPVEAFYDWGGGLVWLLVAGTQDAGAGVVRAEIAQRGGHATLVRAPDPVRSSVAVFQPEAPPLARFSAGLREKFDPHGILNPGRMSA